MLYASCEQDNKALLIKNTSLFKYDSPLELPINDLRNPYTAIFMFHERTNKSIALSSLQSELFLH